MDYLVGEITITTGMESYFAMESGCLIILVTCYQAIHVSLLKTPYIFYCTCLII